MLLKERITVMKSKARALYIHIPFCRNICTYCDFKKFIYNQTRIDNYFKSLFFDLQKYENNRYKSIYIGGGTPSCIDLKNLNDLLKKSNSLLDGNYNILHWMALQLSPTCLCVGRFIPVLLWA